MSTIRNGTSLAVAVGFALALVGNAMVIGAAFAWHRQTVLGNHAAILANQEQIAGALGVDLAHPPGDAGD